MGPRVLSAELTNGGLIQQETLDELTNYKLVFRCGGGIHTDSAGRFSL